MMHKQQQGSAGSNVERVEQNELSEATVLALGG